MSKKLGFQFLANFVDLDTGEILCDELPDFVKFNGFTYPLPRYYRKLFDLPAREFEFMIDKLYKKYGNIKRAYVALSNMRDAADRKLAAYNNNSNL